MTEQEDRPLAVYRYEALNEKGEKRTGLIEGETPRDARTRLRRAGYLPVTVVELPPERMDRGQRRLLPFRRSLFQEVTDFTRQLSTLLRAGIHIHKALETLIHQTRSAEMQAILRDVRDRIQKGEAFSDALAPHKRAFSDLYVNMVRAGEKSGNLPEILERIGLYYKRQNQIRNKVSAALAYPLIMTVVGTGVVIFLMTVVVPKILRLVTKRGGALPLPTQMLIAISAFLQHFWWVIVGSLLLGGLLLRLVLQTDRGRYAFDAFLLKLPLFGELFRKQAISRFAITFSTLLKSGIQELPALEIVERIVGNKVLEEALRKVRERITEGKDIASSLEETKLFPPVVQCMIATGEESGHLEEILEQLAEAYDEEIDVATQKLTSLLEPVLIVLLACVVGFIVMAIVLPMVQGFQI